MNREERIYSVTMTEDELRLFSEFLEQKEYARGVVSKMNPNMVRNGRLTAGKASSSKQARNSSYRRALQAHGEKSVKYESRNGRTVEVPGSRAEFNDKVAEAKKHDRLSSRTSDINHGMPGRYVPGWMNDIQVNAGNFRNVHDSINAKEAVAKNLVKRDHSMSRYLGKDQKKQWQHDHGRNISDGGSWSTAESMGGSRHHYHNSLKERAGVRQSLPKDSTPRVRETPTFEQKKQEMKKGGLFRFFRR